MGAANKRLAQVSRPREAGMVPSAIYAESGVRNPDPALPLQFRSRRVADDAAAAGDRSYAPCIAGRRYRTSQLKTPLASSKRAQAAIDDEIGASNVATLVRSQKQCGTRNLLGATKAVERSGGLEALPYCIGAFFRCRLRINDGRIDRTGSDRIDTDATILELRRPRAYKRTNAGLGSAVCGVAWNSLERGDGRNQDDGATIADERQCLLDCEEKPAHIDAEGLVEIFFRRINEWLRIDEARVCNQDIDLSLLSLSLSLSLLIRS